MPPHGAGMIGAGHSHNPEYPDDAWNLYAHLVAPSNEGGPSTGAQVTALNVTRPQDVIRIFKPYVRRLEPLPAIVSDADDEIIVIAPFVSPVNIRKIIVIGGTAEDNYGSCPLHLKMYVNLSPVDFTSIGAHEPAYETDIAVNPDGTRESVLPLNIFNNVTTLIMYFSGAHNGGDNTSLSYIGLQGDHTHYRREAVKAMYELLCPGHGIDVSSIAANAEASSH